MRGKPGKVDNYRGGQNLAHLAETLGTGFVTKDGFKSESFDLIQTRGAFTFVPMDQENWMHNSLQDP